MLNKDVLSMIVEKMLNSDAAQVSMLKEPVASIRNEYLKTAPQLNYENNENAKAYMVAYFPYYVAPIYQVLESLPNEVTSAVFSKDEIEVCALGCGPAPEILGLASYIDEYFSELLKINVNLHDVNIESWDEFIRLSLGNISQLCWKGKFGYNRVECNLTEKCGSCFKTNCRAYKRSADVYIIQNCLKDVINHGNAVQSKLLEMFKTAKPGAMFILIDIASSDSRNIMNRLEKCVTSLGIGKVVKSVGSATQCIRKQFEIPTVLNENLFSKKNGLNAKNNVNFISSVIIKETVLKKFSKEKEEKVAECLFVLLHSQDKESISDLLKQYPFLANAVEEDGTPVLSSAAMYSNSDNNLLDAFISNGADLNALDTSQMTALHRSVLFGNKDSVYSLIEGGADIDATDNEERTPLMTAAMMGRTEILKIILNNGANYKLQDRNGCTAMHYAAASGDFSGVRQLIDAGAETITRDYSGQTPLHHAAGSGQISTANLLINIRTINSKDLQRCTPLHFAVLEGYTGMIKCLLARGANTGARDVFNKTPYDYAIKKRNRKAALLMGMSRGNILNLSEDINWTDPNEE